ncbi:hypothetical protein AVEN_258784-1 [Araneus ventricosus]|uniref:Uncharacterized protein n=1 Tax=Araneus ventricosus TaxID=182803 RepID=A0A4Y2D2L0_ARAVE|nr:hypothetical protein AVEN_258784-1 [Araneus ventricosus]
MTHPSADRESISVPIGADCLWKIAKEELKRINENAITLDTIFGWCIQGRFSLSELNSAESICSNLLDEEKLPRTLESFWIIESLGVNNPYERLEDEEALRFFENSIQQKNDRYLNIQKAFLQISVSCEDQDAMRFLWIHDDSNLSNPKVQIYRMCHVMFGAKSSPFLLSACIKHHLRKFESEYPKTVELLNNYMCFDVCICTFSTCGTNTQMEAIEVYHNANTIMKKASMTLTKWNSNSVLRKEYETDKHKDSTPLCDSSSKV